MTEHMSLTNTVAVKETSTFQCEVTSCEENGATSVKSTSFSENLRHWFLHLSPEERAAVLGFVDGRMMTVLAKAVAFSFSTPTSGLEPPIVVGGVGDAAKNDAFDEDVEDAGIERMAGRRSHADGIDFDWEAKIPLTVLEKIWQEVVEANTDVKSSPKDDGDKCVVADAAVTEVIERVAVVDVEEDAAKTDMKDLSDARNADLLRVKNKENKQSEVFRIQKEVTEEECKDENIPLTTLGVSDVATVVAINSDEHEGDVVKEGDGIMSGEEQKEESTSIDSVIDRDATNTIISGTTEPQIRATSEKHLIPQFSSISTSSSSENSENTFTKTINELMVNTCTIFPAAFNHSNGAAPDSYITANLTTTGETTLPQQKSQALHHPFITLHPSYLNSISGEDLLFTLDCLVAKGSMTDSRTFLPTNNYASESWIEHVRSFVTPEAGEPELSLSEASPLLTPIPSTALSIPLYMLFLTRFQQSVVNSYQEVINISAPRYELAVVADGQMKFMFGVDKGLVDLSTKLQILFLDTKNAKSHEMEDALETPLSRVNPIDTSDVKQSLAGYLIQPCSVFLKRISSELADKHGDVQGLIQSTKKVSSDALSAEALSVDIKDVSRFSTSDEVIKAETTIEVNLPSMVEAMSGINIETTGTLTTEGSTPRSIIRTEAQGSKKSKKKKKKKKKRNAGSVAAGESIGPVPATDDYIDNTEDEFRLNEIAFSGDKTFDTIEDQRIEDRTNELVVLDEIVEVADEKVVSDVILHEAVGTKDEPGIPSEIVDSATVELTEGIDEGAVGADEQTATSKNILIPPWNPVTPDITSETDKSISSVDTPEDNGWDKASDESQDAQESGLHVSKDGAVSVVAAIDAKEAVDVSKSEDVDTEETTQEGQDDEWETVEAKPRGSRKKATDRGSHVRSFSQNGSFGGSHGANLKKKAPKTKEVRNRIKARKIVKDILSSVLDAVEDERLRRRSASREAAKIHGGATRQKAPPATDKVDVMKDAGASTPQNGASHLMKGATMRDILVGSMGVATTQNGPQGQKKESAAFNVLPAPRVTPLTYSEKARVRSEDARVEGRNANWIELKPAGKVDQMMLVSPKKNGTPNADQNTIPTVPETLSAVSTNSAFTPSIANVTPRDPGVTQSTDSSTDESVEVPKAQSTPTSSSKEGSPSPPLPTLLSPGNNNSASSSVASSLDAPHAGHHGNLSNPSENDVGYHLLDVCGKLSGEISVFMKRREDALKVRRQERGLVLEALGETLRTIWPGMCTVEMYGSCATNLDLPSSDLDVVVCGLDRPQRDATTSPSKAPSGKKSNVTEEGLNQEKPLLKVKSHQEFPPYAADQPYSPHHMSPHHMQMMYGHMSLNAERVLRLALELERQPWAVHVKAIPTASVPVIKILADPARLPGALANGSGDWLMQHTMATQASASMNGPISTANLNSKSGNQPPVAHYPSGQHPPLWRGADVVNGLLKVDITFEGPEHGGIGSTKFSSRVVEEFSKETGLPPECTPQVQVLMVLKELLAQRRLNEPFSGGLSSYALLLLVISVIAERGIIREELDRVEQQRMVVAAGGGNSTLRSPTSMVTTEEKFLHERFQRKKDAPPKPEDVRPKPTKHNSTNHKGRVLNQVIAPKGEVSEPNAKGLDATKFKGTTRDAPEMTEEPSKISQDKALKHTEPSSKLTLGPSTSSWASVAKKPTSDKSLPRKASIDSTESNSSQPSGVSGMIPSRNKTLKKPSSFADAVSNGAASMAAPSLSGQQMGGSKKNEGNSKANPENNDGNSLTHRLLSSSGRRAGVGTDISKKVRSNPTESNPSVVATERSTASTSVSSFNPPRINTGSSTNNPSTDAITSVNGPDSSLFPQGFHDVIEVLCSGETTSGKLLMHILLFYGQHFDSQSTAIDYSGTHRRDVSNGGNLGYSIRSPYLQRRTAGTYDPVTGMLTVDPIVVYDPLEGAENNNVARSCFAWSSIRWVFAQSYMTLSSAVETNAGQGSGNRAASGEGPAYGHDESGNVVVDPSSPLLELLLSF